MAVEGLLTVGAQRGDRARFLELDGVRAVAVMIVVIGHMTTTYDDLYGVDFGWPFPFEFGRFGVHLFFLVSGFVILMSVQRVRRPSDFAISRFSRLFPAYWIAVSWSILMALVFHPRDVTYSWIDRALNYTMLQRFLGGGAVDTVYWTLAVELQFYALILLMLYVSKCRITPRLVYLFCGMWVFLTTLIALFFGGYSRGHAASEAPFLYKQLFNVFLVEYAPLFCAGMFFFLARSGRGVAWLCAGVCSVAAVLQGELMHGMTTAIPVACVCGFFAFVCAVPHVAPLRWRPVQWVGRRSYSLYLIHNVTGLIVVHLLAPLLGRIPAVLVAIAVALGAAHCLYVLGEQTASRVARSWAQRARARMTEQR